jgi:hypothetical protein
MAEQPEINADTVDALLARTDRLIDDEIAVAEGLKTRAAGLTGLPASSFRWRVHLGRSATRLVFMEPRNSW